MRGSTEHDEDYRKVKSLPRAMAEFALFRWLGWGLWIFNWIFMVVSILVGVSVALHWISGGGF